jgi:hypothetical protein
VCERERERERDVFHEKEYSIAVLRRMFHKEIARQQCHAQEHCTELRKNSKDKFTGEQKYV